MVSALGHMPSRSDCPRVSWDASRPASSPVQLHGSGPQRPQPTRTPSPDRQPVTAIPKRFGESLTRPRNRLAPPVAYYTRKVGFDPILVPRNLTRRVLNAETLFQ